MRLGIEPEPGNVVRDARTAARLLDELGHDAPVGIVLDPANLLSPETVSRQSEILAEAVDLLGPSVVGIQAKDVAASGSAAAGAGLLDYPGVFRQLARLAPVPLIVQDAARTTPPASAPTSCAGTGSHADAGGGTAEPQARSFALDAENSSSGQHAAGASPRPAGPTRPVPTGLYGSSGLGKPVGGQPACERLRGADIVTQHGGVDLQATDLIGLARRAGARRP